MSDIPAGPWVQVCVNFYGFVSGTNNYKNYILVVIDEHSRYPEVRIVRSTSAEAVIPKMDRMFDMQGIPEQISTYNCSAVPWSELFSIQPRKRPPTQQNYTMWTKSQFWGWTLHAHIGLSIETSVADGRNWRKELNQFLLNGIARFMFSTVCQRANRQLRVVWHICLVYTAIRQRQTQAGILTPVVPARVYSEKWVAECKTCYGTAARCLIYSISVVKIWSVQ